MMFPDKIWTNQRDELRGHAVQHNDGPDDHHPIRRNTLTGDR